MRRALLLCMACMVSFASGGQAPLSIAYERAGDELGEVLEFQGLRYLRVVLSGDIGGKSCSVAEVSCHDGEFVSRDLLSLLGTVRLSDSDTLLRIVFLSRAVGTDSVQIGVRLPFCSVRSGFSHEAGAVSYMLLEPSALSGCGSQSRPRDYAVGDTIPVMACTAGIPKTAEYGGQKLEHFDFCSLRDDPVHPRDWYDKYGIRHYVWYEVRLAD